MASILHVLKLKIFSLEFLGPFRQGEKEYKMSPLIACGMQVRFSAYIAGMTCAFPLGHLGRLERVQVALEPLQ